MSFLVEELVQQDCVKSAREVSILSLFGLFGLILLEGIYQELNDEDSDGIGCNRVVIGYPLVLLELGLHLGAVSLEVGVDVHDLLDLGRRHVHQNVGDVHALVQNCFVLILFELD